jgi:hypothetical protein
MTAIDLQLIADCAALAPSVHNTQPWQFVLRGDVLEVRLDRSRRLGFLDPDGRLQHISCGAAVELARLAVRVTGSACTVDWLPDAADPDIVAHVNVGDSLPPTADEQALAEAMARRYTDRGPYDGRRVPPTLVAELRHTLSAYGVWLRTVERDADRVGLAALLGDAEVAEAREDAYASELARWVHVGPDGVPAPAAPDWPADVVTDMPLRQFVPDGRTLHPGGAVPPTVVRDSVFVLGTDADGPHEWLAVGAALARTQLRLADLGMTCQPLGPATDFPAARARLRSELWLHGHPQFVLRVGYGSARPWTGRRDADEVLVVSS